MNRIGSLAPDLTLVPDDRGLSPVVGKTLELGVGVLFVALLTTTLFGGVAPDYRAAVGVEVGDRTLVAAAERVEAAVPAPDTERIERGVTLPLPPTIHGESYRLVAESTPTDSAIRLVHPDSRIGGRVRLSIPEDAAVSGSVDSASPSQIRVTGGGDGLTVRLTDSPALAAESRTTEPTRIERSGVSNSEVLP